MSSIHAYAWCSRCGWHVENPTDAETERHRKMPGHVTNSRFHERRWCTPECQQRSTKESA